ncbi:unnamed protein product [Thlaspi arvense]|uniref:Uncharacterized protein n=1 Tax=Thlaspi arvense TaxID=13288 RepID=A0AAU9RFH4_THLAR|nr:unnamed protein product [Thlaspi arvense]
MLFSSLTVKRLPSVLLAGESPRRLKISLISEMILFSTSGCFCITQQNHESATELVSRPAKMKLVQNCLKNLTVEGSISLPFLRLSI